MKEFMNPKIEIEPKPKTVTKKTAAVSRKTKEKLSKDKAKVK